MSNKYLLKCPKQLSAVVLGKSELWSGQGHTEWYESTWLYIFGWPLRDIRERWCGCISIITMRRALRECLILDFCKHCYYLHVMHCVTMHLLQGRSIEQVGQLAVWAIINLRRSQSGFSRYSYFISFLCTPEELHITLKYVRVKLRLLQGR